MAESIRSVSLSSNYGSASTPGVLISWMQQLKADAGRLSPPTRELEH
ncbi:hypothetical protein ACIFOE_25830 [Paenibacillus sp. NRS-1783]